MPPTLSPRAAPDPERVGAAAFVLSLRARGISNTDLLRAMETVPRDYFAPRRFADLARADVALPLACGQTMSSPATVAAMLAALGPEPGDRVLEVGTGSGYVTALLTRLGCRVRSLERNQALALSAARRLAGLAMDESVEIACRDGLAGNPDGEEDARYERILLNGVLSCAPPSCVTTALAVGGRLVGALAVGGAPRLLVVTRGADGTLAQALGAAVRLAPLMDRSGRNPSSRNANLT